MSSTSLPTVSAFTKAKITQQKELLNKYVAETKESTASTYNRIYTRYDPYNFKNAICSIDNRESAKERNKWSKIIFVVLIVFLILLIFSIGFYIRQSNNDSKYDPIYGIVFGCIGIIGCVLGHYFNSKTYLEKSKYDDDDTDIESLKNNKKEIKTTLKEISSLKKEISLLQRNLIYENKKRDLAALKEKSKQIVQDYKNKSKVQPSLLEEETAKKPILLRQNAQSDLLEEENISKIKKELENKQSVLNNLNIKLGELKNKYVGLKTANDSYNELKEYYKETLYLVAKRDSDVDKTEKDAADINENLKKMNELFNIIQQFYNDFNQQEQKNLKHIKEELENSEN